MLKRLFGRNKPQSTQPTLPSTWKRVAWQSPQIPYLDYFNLHLHGLSLEETIRSLEAKYLNATVTAPAILVWQQGEWINAYFSRDLVAAVGFNKLSSEIAREHDIWLIGYRIYAEQGIDVHYFDGGDHVAGLAVGEDELEREPLAAETFAALADVSHLMPRPETLHPLDFHFGLLEAVGIRDAALTWDEALRRYEAGELAGARLLPPTAPNSLARWR
jgi:hypothetical protein